MERSQFHFAPSDLLDQSSCVLVITIEDINDRSNRPVTMMSHDDLLMISLDMKQFNGITMAKSTINEVKNTNSENKEYKRKEEPPKKGNKKNVEQTPRVEKPRHELDFSDMDATLSPLLTGEPSKVQEERLTTVIVGKPMKNNVDYIEAMTKVSKL
ncbi:unnamed protein product [Arabis nemorensis]|uniref:Uncharacterized protein n=1 Tax=Arabis nemorensis TaxID=586526 RepID=A0A565CBA6_9BRAS|nr:unnamed protein product [Arabis nemorensis]